MAYKRHILEVQLLSENAFIPERKSDGAAGYDLSSAQDFEIEPLGKLLVKTDIAIRVPEGYYGRIAPRSSLAINNHIAVGAGVIDRDYTGNVGVVLFNHSSVMYLSGQKGDRIAQLIIEKISTPDVVVVEKLQETKRGEGGFGSTGVNSNFDESKNNTKGEIRLQNRKFRDTFKNISLIEMIHVIPFIASVIAIVLSVISMYGKVHAK
jgi:dUTP pyrophosphatase